MFICMPCVRCDCQINLKFCMFVFIKRYPCSIIVIAIIIFLSFFNVEKPSFVKMPNIDKLVHFLMYAGFCSVLWFEYFISHKRVRKSHAVTGAIIAPIVFSALIEVLQSLLTSSRKMDFLDFVFNVIGVFFALLIAKFVIRPVIEKYKKRKRNKHMSQQ